MLKRLLTLCLTFVLLLQMLQNVTAITDLSDLNTFEDELNFTVTPAVYGNVDRVVFPIYQEALAVSVYGITGMGILAYFDGAPGKIYVAHKMVALTNPSIYSSGVPHIPSAIARVTDPDGNIAAVYDFSYLDVGETAAIINIPQGKAGIWSIQLMNGRTGDTLAIGIRNTNYWGVRGEKLLGASSTIPKPSYIYSQRTAQYIYVGSSSKVLTLSDISGNMIQSGIYRNRAFTTYDLYTENIEPNTVYRIDYPENFLGNTEIDGVSGLMCPTAEAAAFLKGGWVDTKDSVIELEDGTIVTDTTGLMLQGPLQARARRELIRLVSEKDVGISPTKDSEGNYIINKPALDDIIDSIENPQAEAQLFGSYGVLSSVGGMVKRQITNITNKHLGRVLTNEEYMAQGGVNDVSNIAGFESCNFENYIGHRYIGSNLATAATIPLKLNYLYENQALITRSAMCLLYSVVAMSEEGEIRQGNLYTQTATTTAGMFVLDAYENAFSMIAEYLDQETQDILFQALLLMCDKMGDYRGQGVTNQCLFCIKTNLGVYRYTGAERYHENFKRQINAIMSRTWKELGFVYEAGYFNEGGCDSSYEYMNRQEFYTIYNKYKKLPYADQTILEGMKKVIERSLEFESFFCAPQPSSTTLNNNILAPNHFTSRTINSFGGGNQPSYEQIFHEFPLAGRRMQVRKTPNSGLSNSGSYPHVINSDEWALRHIRTYYDSYIYGFNEGGSSWPGSTYDAYNAETYCEPNAIMPYEAEDGSIWERMGFIAFQHMGIYCYSFYGTESTVGSEYTYMGGGPTAVWTRETGNTLLSQKHLSGKNEPTTPSDIVSSCIYGYDASGNFIYSGREGNLAKGANKFMSFKWIVPQKVFEVSGRLPNDTRNISWTYHLNENGVAITAKMSPVNSGEEFWLNLPITFEDPSLNVQEQGNGRLVLNYNNSKLTYSWDENCEYTFLSSVKNENLNYSTKCLRIKLDENGEATIQITPELPDIQLTAFDTYQETDINFESALPLADGKLWALVAEVKNNTQNEQRIKALCAMYTEDNRLLEFITCDTLLNNTERKKLTFGATLDAHLSGGKIKLFIWKDLESITPCIKNVNRKIN